MKLTRKNLLLALAFLALCVTGAVFADGARKATQTSAQGQTSVRVEVVDESGAPLHNATVKVQGVDNRFLTDDKGNSPVIETGARRNAVDATQTEWYCVNVLIEKEGYVPTFLINVVVISGQTRLVKAKVYADDDSHLPYVCYVESPPDDYLRSLVGK